MSEVGTLKKGIDIFWLIIERGSLSVLEIMDILQYNRSTTYRLVNTLEQNHLIQKTAENNYEVSNQLVEKLLSHDSHVTFDLNLAVIRAADEFKKLTGETIYVGVLNGTNVLASHIIPGSYPTRTHFEKGEKLPAHQSAVGKCILAFQSSKIQDMFKNKLKTDLAANSEAFFKELKQVKKDGFAIDNEEAEAGVRCVAAPIWKDDRIIAGIAISGPSARMSQEMDEENSKLVKLFSRKITGALENPILYS